MFMVMMIIIHTFVMMMIANKVTFFLSLLYMFNSICSMLFQFYTASRLYVLCRLQSEVNLRSIHYNCTVHAKKIKMSINLKIEAILSIIMRQNVDTAVLKWNIHIEVFEKTLI